MTEDPAGCSVESDTAMPKQAVTWQTQRILNILDELGIDIPKSAKILDFGCGKGGIFKDLRSSGYVNAEGYDLAESSRLSEERDHLTTGSIMNQCLPYADNTFDLIISDQVFEHVQDQATVFKELYRITRPGGHGLHCIPARYMPIEGHIHVPLGGVLQHRWWYKTWALLGIRHEGQKGWSADRTADWNAWFVTAATRYVTTSCYRAVWQDIGFRYQFAEQQFFGGHVRSSMRLLAKGGRPIAWLYRTFRGRWAYLQKPS